MNIGFLAKMGSGKTTCAEYITKNYNYEEVFFAKALKDVIQYLFKFTDEQLYGSEKQKTDEFWNISPRQAMQFIGTELFRDQMDKLIPGMSQDFWIKVLERALSKDKNYVFSDCRMQNEIDFIKNRSPGNGIVVKIIRPCIEKNKDDTSKHATETGIDYVTGYDYIIINDGTKEELYAKLDELMNSITNSRV
jgi:hypothetical protein